jgi:hypothetical protein
VISQSRYVKIVSGVGAGANVAQRSLGMRVITQNNALQPGIIAQFTGPDPTPVGAFFGVNSEEYARATAYFGFISKQTNSPATISFARWVNSSIAPAIVGDALAKVLASFTAVTAGTLTINSGGTLQQISGINFSAATSLTQAAATLQTAIRTSADPQLATATVTFNTNTSQFVLTGATVGSGTLSAVLGGSPALGTDVAGIVGWGTTGAVNVAGQAADSALQAVTKSTAISNNFGSFVFATPTAPLATADITAIAAWNKAQNNLYVYSVAVTMANLATISAAVIGESGCALNLLSSTLPNDYVEQCPCEILAATDYTALNATQNYMYYQFPNRNTTVTDDTTANTVDALRCNYIGATQVNGQVLAFYQRGLMCGLAATDAVDMNTYANEMSLKSALSAAIFSFFLAVGRVPANTLGVGQTLAILQAPITAYKNNGTISPGKTLSVLQQQAITLASGDANAYRQVSTIGYWVTMTFSPQVNSNTGLTEYLANYILIYAKDDAIRVVNGQDILI